MFNGWQCPEDGGGGISLINNAQPILQRVIISDNIGVYGGGLYSDHGFNVIQGKFVGNNAILYGGGAFSADGASVSDTLLDNNHCGIKGCLGGGLSVGDPCFVDPAHDDYHLAFGSAAIDRGIDAGIYGDLDGHPRPIGLGFDIGAYEYQSIRYLWLPVIRR